MKTTSTKIYLATLILFTLLNGCGSQSTTKKQEETSVVDLNATQEMPNTTSGTQTSTGNITNTIPTVINGYTLPPEPDPTLNNSTLLGVDSNDNGVRDDVERKIIVKYKKPIEIELMMSFAKVDQETLEKPLSEALNLERKASRIGDCKMFLRYKGIKIKRAIKYSEDWTYNTKERAKKYIEYNKKLSGGVYGSSPADWNADSCDFDVEQMLKDRK